MNILRTMEFYEAFYLFEQFKQPNEALEHTVRRIEIETNVFIAQALVRILVAAGYLERLPNELAYSHDFERIEREVLTSETYLSQQEALTAFCAKARDPHYNFFDHLSQLEYEIYAQHNYEVNYGIGRLAGKHLKLGYIHLLEMGGNSGGFAAGLKEEHLQLHYTIVDRQIPCEVGRQIQQGKRQQTNFVIGDAFELNLSPSRFDYWLFMNFFHDYSDEEIKTILRGVRPYGHQSSQLIVIEDALASEQEPEEVIRQGLRLAVACKGGRQRTVAEMVELLESEGFALEDTVVLNPFQTMLRFKQKSSS